MRAGSGSQCPRGEQRGLCSGSQCPRGEQRVLPEVVEVKPHHQDCPMQHVASGAQPYTSLLPRKTPAWPHTLQRLPLHSAGNTLRVSLRGPLPLASLPLDVASQSPSSPGQKLPSSLPPTPGSLLCSSRLPYTLLFGNVTHSVHPALPSRHTRTSTPCLALHSSAYGSSTLPT